VVRGLLYSEHGMKARMKQLDMIANNLANANTTGYKRDVIFNEALSLESMKNKSLVPCEQLSDFSQGVLQETGNHLDFAIKGNAFFCVQGPEEIRFTRNGNFQVDAEGYLCTSDGSKVLGERGPILVSEDFNVGEQGEIVENGTVIDRFNLVEFDDLTQLRKEGNGYFSYQNENNGVQPAEKVTLLQGFVENSNTNPINEMVTMIELYRQFEADQKAIRTQDDTLGKAINDVGRVAG
jgi:flagellar basal-body rod protein FlgF